MTLPFGIDISQFQCYADGSKKINFDCLKQHNPKISFIIARATISWAGKDTRFDWYWQEMQRIGVCRAAYHFAYHSQDYKRQANWFLTTVNPQEHDRLAIDLEVVQGVGKIAMTDFANALISYIQECTGKRPILYSRKQWLEDYLYPDRLVPVDLWLAQYANVQGAYAPEKTPPPDLPKGFSTWLIHQTGGYCKPFCNAASKVLDYDRWNGTEEDVRTYFGYTEQPEPPTPPEPPEPPAEEFPKVGIVIADPSVNIRKEASIQSADIGDFVKGANLNLIGEQGDFWQVSAWVAKQWVQVNEPYQPPEPPAEEVPLYKAVVVTTPPNRLRVRFSPAGNFKRWLQSGEEVNVYQELGDWRRIEADGWSAAEWLQRIDETPPGEGENIFYSQRDPRWGEDFMGASTIKMKNEGCLATATAALLTRLGFPETPGTYNDKAGRLGGYQYPNLMYWNFPHVLYPQIVKSEDKSFSYGTGFESYLDRILNDGRDALAMVDFVPGGTFNQHWVRIYKREGGLYYLHDPWYGNSQALHARYQKLFRIVGYRRTA